jgi:hypothetical protein
MNMQAQFLTPSKNMRIVTRKLGSYQKLTTTLSGNLYHKEWARASHLYIWQLHNLKKLLLIYMGQDQLTPVSN